MKEMMRKKKKYKKIKIKIEFNGKEHLKVRTIRVRYMYRKMFYVIWVFFKITFTNY